MRRRLEVMEHNSKNEVENFKDKTRGGTWFNRNASVPTAPIFIATTEDIGTKRARANHVGSSIHYCEEQVLLKLAKTPL
jgi:hypothetical protein